MSKTNSIVTFVDHIGRTIIGGNEGDTDKGVAFLVKNPAIIHVQPTQTGQLNVQTIPMFFREFLPVKCAGRKYFCINRINIFLPLYQE